ncbi:MAG: hypothetical protein KDC44_17675, partial [Phaeodactylibacter sp.]|nr:hypothetical protein [Phaeodactylibacter sp.]
MKPTLSFLFVICLFTTTLNAQFELIPSGTGATLYDVDFPSDQVGFAVGDSGVVLKTIDGGNSW